jgi:hypothetical protein
MNKLSSLASALCLVLVAASSASAAELVLVSGDVGTGLGLEDPTPKAPEGLNPGTTLGEQRTLAYLFAADLWGAVLESDATIYVGASFQPLACTPTSGTLGSAGTTFVFTDFAPGVKPNTWYSSALADSLAGSDLNPGFIDINSRFNGDIGVNPNCLTGSDWYYGLDGNTPTGKINFLNVVMHEIGHGLGFQGFTNSAGGFFNGRQDIYSTFAYDNVLAKYFPEMTAAERSAALRNTGRLVWSGETVNEQAALVLDNRSVLSVSSPAAIAGSYEIGFAGFGPAPTRANFAGTIVAALDGAGASTLDACEPITNAAAIAGNIALVDRGSCAFVIKAANVQNAGAAGMLVANTAAGAPALGGSDPSITIPSLSVSQADGALIRANLPVQASFMIDPTLLQGADNQGRVRLYAPNPYESGSSFSHYDTALLPNALMEPAITASLRGNYNIDLTPALFQDIGWQVNPGNARIGNCTTNVDVVGDGGLIPGANVQAWSNLCLRTNSSKGAYQSCMDGYKTHALSMGILTGNQGGKVMSCAAKIGK